MAVKLSTGRVAMLTWVLIFGGMLMLALGLVVRRGDDGLGWGIVVASIASILIGVVLIWVRSRMNEDDQP